MHDRMPVIVALENCTPSLDASLDDPIAVARMLLPRLAQLLRTYPVCTRVSIVKSDAPDLSEAIRA